MQEIDSVKNILNIQRVGQAYTARHLSLDHLKGFC